MVKFRKNRCIAIDAGNYSFYCMINNNKRRCDVSWENETKIPLTKLV